jgi:PAS domain S-box-containing protein
LPDHAIRQTEATAFPWHDGETSRLIRRFDWASTALGPIENWPQPLKSTVGLMVQSPVPMVLLWGADGYMIYNDAYSRFAGGRHPELLGGKVREAWAEVADFNDNVMKVGLAGGTLAYRDHELTLFRNGAGEQVWMNLDYSPVLEEAGKPAGVIAIVVETTAHVLAERRNAAEQERLAKMFDQSPGFITMLEGPEHRIELANQSYYRLVGERNLVGQTVANALPDAAAQGFVEILDEVFRTGKTYTSIGAKFDAQPLPGGPINERYVDFVYQPVTDAAGHVTGIFVEGSDVTERVLGEVALRASESQFRTSAQSMLNHVWTASPDGQLDWFNERVLSYSGLAERELLGSGWTRIVHPEDLSHAAPLWTAALASGETYETEFRLRRADGAYRWHIARAVAIRNDSGEIERWVGTNTDIDDQKTAAHALANLNETLEAQVKERTEELMAAEESLRQAQKMEAVGQLTGGLAHDFNNLLTGITGSLELAQKRVIQGRFNDLDRYLHAAQDAARRAAALTHRLLAFSRRQTLDPKPIDMNQLVGSMDDLIRRTVGPAITVEFTAAGELWNTCADPNQLENALLNLCINARDAMPNGGRLIIETGNRELDEREAKKHDLSAGHYVVLSVTDTGGGMPPDVVARAFDPFFTTKPLGSGTGLGLSMIYGFVRQSGGQARIYSEIGKGSMVCLYLPRYLGELETDEDRQTFSGVSRAEHGETVLVVDDEPTIRMLVTEVLEGLGYAAIEAEDGRAGLKILESPARVDLLITDVGLPGGMNGRQLADFARTRRPDLKVLFITGYAENAVVGDGRLAHGMHVMTKPFAMDSLAVRIEDILKSAQ